MSRCGRAFIAAPHSSPAADDDGGGPGPKQADAAHPLTSTQRSSLGVLASKFKRTTGSRGIFPSRHLTHVPVPFAKCA